MKCRYCEVEISPKEKICHHCGRFLGNEKEDATTAPKKSRTTIWIALGVIGVAVAFILTTFGGMMLNQKATNEQLQQKIAAVTPANNLGLTFKQFKDYFNQNDAARNAKIQIEDSAAVNADNGLMLQQIFSDKLVLNGMFAKLDHKALELQVRGVPGSTREDQTKFIASIGALIDIFSPELYEDEKRTLMNDLGFDKNTDLSKVNKTVIRGSVKYTFKFIKDAGFVFSVTNASQQ